MTYYDEREFFDEETVWREESKAALAARAAANKARDEFDRSGGDRRASKKPNGRLRGRRQTRMASQGGKRSTLSRPSPEKPISKADSSLGVSSSVRTRLAEKRLDQEQSRLQKERVSTLRPRRYCQRSTTGKMDTMDLTWFCI